jgi:hypothetical protein
LVYHPFSREAQPSAVRETQSAGIRPLPELEFRLQAVGWLLTFLRTETSAG